MSKKYEEMSEKELLIELIQNQKRESKHEKISAIANVSFVLVVIVALLICIPYLVRTVNTAQDTMLKMQETLTETEKTVDQAQASLDTIDTLIGQAQGSLDGIDEMVGNVNTVVTDNTDAVTESLEKIGAIDVDSLNRSIQEFGDILAPISRLFGS